MFISLGMFLLFLVVNNIGTAVTVTRLLLLESGKYLNIIYLVFVLKYQFSNHHRTVHCPGTLRTQLISEIESFRRPKIIINRKNAQNGEFLKLQFRNEAWLDMEQWGYEDMIKAGSGPWQRQSDWCYHSVSFLSFISVWFVLAVCCLPWLYITIWWTGPARPVTRWQEGINKGSPATVESVREM